jgi:hypothetical protein
MNRPIWLPLAGSLLLLPSSVRTLEATDLKATVGTRLEADECVKFFDDPHGTKPLKKNERLLLHIVNLCGRPMKIRVDRRPNKDFSKRCNTDGANGFKFESDDNTLADQDDRLVTCVVAGADEATRYAFQTSASSVDKQPSPDLPSSPHGAESASQAKPPIITSFLEVEVDP